MNYLDFYSLLKRNKMITDIYEYLLCLIADELKDNEFFDSYLILFSIYFSLIGDGNVAISLNKDILLEKWKKKLASVKILMEEEDDFDEQDLELILNESIHAMDICLDKIGSNYLPTLISEKGMFEVEDSYLYVRKYNVARKGIINSLDRLFSTALENEPKFNYQSALKAGFKLSRGQQEAFNRGLNRNLIITGGPGTGKTTSIIFLLMNLLYDDENRLVYLIAPSGKASNRMKESLIGGLGLLDESFKNAHSSIVDKITHLEESTIHRLLSLDYETQAFSYNKEHLFPNNSIFIIDEASMIDLCLFNSLLQAIPSSSRVFIMGDKNQLPSVEAGAVFGELLKKESLKDYVVELDESIRFTSDTKIYALASAINTGSTLPVQEGDWKDYDSFEVIKNEDKTKPIFYYRNYKEGVNEKDIVEYVIKKWGGVFFSDLQNRAMNLDENDIESLNNLCALMEKSKILSAENLGVRGVSTINEYIKLNFIDKTKGTSILGFYPGEIMMINKNNKMLDLYNGDNGILVTFKDDETVYFMVQKSSLLIEKEGKKKDKIFKLGKYVFYPIRMITRDEIDLAYAISVHKSQGSDYKNIFVILPNKKGHPLLNRQIVYTAITRTKGNTYILSNQERLEESKNSILIRDTLIA